jgi:uncharacterized protein YdeI (YjbR/CyaY-like superfamily)
MIINAAHILAFATPRDFGNWLSKSHARESEVWLEIQKKASGVTSVTWAEAVVEALAWGWIDGIKKTNGQNSWFQRFTPRTPKSNWSKINCRHAEKLIADGRMQKTGLKAVNAAKLDGRWQPAREQTKS